MSKTWLSPAKINLFLHITSKRLDGYHNLQTIFQLLDYCDEMTFKVTKNGVIRRVSGNEDVKKDKDLIILAAKALQKETNIVLGADISVIKNIPSGGGLGGGSSNAACALVALNELWNTKLSESNLIKIGQKLGADVPIFIKGKSAWAEGVGDILTPMALPQHYFLIVSINKHISTTEIFSHKALTMTPQIGKISFFSELIDPHNDCLQAAIELEREILEVMKHLKTCNGAVHEPRMTGTGSCIFLEFKSEIDALVAYNNLPTKWLGFNAKAINTSPLYSST
ncbi:MAG: 4-(cytidine 5'-diphospho)-2-C-methyl-D-erythritol kinase [Candidatus Thioglobus sp.]